MFRLPSRKPHMQLLVSQKTNELSSLHGLLRVLSGLAEQMCVCASVCFCIHLQSAWQKPLRLTAGTISLIGADEMCEMRDAMQGDPYTLCTLRMDANEIQSLTCYWNKCCTVDWIY